MKRGASGTFRKPQKSLNSLQREKQDKQGIGRDGEYLLKDKRREKAGKVVGTFTSKGLVESVKKDRRDKFRDIEMLLKELEKGRCIVNENILTVCKSIF